MPDKIEGEQSEAGSEAANWTADLDQVGVRLDRALAEGLGVSRARVRHLLEVGRISMAGQVLGLSDKSRKVEEADDFTISGSLRAEDEMPRPRPDLDLTIVAEGLGWIVVDKPPGCGVHPLRPDQEDTVLNSVVAHFDGIVGVGEGGLRSGVVHRLDVDTTGALLFAKDEIHWKRFRGAFSEHRVRKTYLALVAGNFEQARRVDLSLEVTRHHPAHVQVVKGGHACRQHVTPIESFSEATLVEVGLETGFLHQIRATMAHLGHPVVGDAEYASASEYEGDSESEGVASIAAPRQMLHAARLSVDEISVDVPMPADFKAVLESLRQGDRQL
ncbi:MAG TPA: RluA family pseudouridine synthase [Myxococcales bacterium]|nr:RluA family pseudouridine synthase [Myxococcales bacterium]